MKKNILLSLVLLFSINMWANQDHTSDSLKRVIDQYQFEDTVKVKLIYNWFISNSMSLDSTFKNYLKEALEISKKLEYKNGEAEGYFQLGWYYHFKSNPKLAIRYNYKAISLYKELNNKSQLLRTYSNLSSIYNGENDFESALELNLITINLSEDMPDSPTKASYYFYTAKTYDRIVDYDNSLIYFIRAKEISEACNFQVGIEIAKGSIGHVYTMTNQPHKALPLLKESLTNSLKQNNTVNVAAAHKSLAACYFKLDQYQNAIDNLKQAIKIYEEGNYNSLLEDTYREIAEVYQQMGEFEQAIVYFRKSTLAVKERKTEEQTKAIEELKAKYNTSQLEQEKLLAQSNENISYEKEKRSRYISYGLLAISILVIGIMFYIYKQLKIIRSQKIKLDRAYVKLEESKKNELAVSNLKALQSQMNPHFIFNALNSVQDLVLLKDIRSSNKFLGKFSDLIRKILISSKRQFISLEEEIEILSLYLDLEVLRFGEEFKIDFSCAVPIEEQERIQLPAMFIQPYIENAIKHGLFHKKGIKELKVAFSQPNKNLLECVVQDNGVGQQQAAIYKQKRLHLHTGFSKEAIDDRIRLLNETLDKKIDLQIIDLEGNGVALGTKIVLQFPV